MEFVWELLLSGIDSIILYLNKQNKTYRNIVLLLSAEKEDLDIKRTMIKEMVTTL